MVRWFLKDASRACEGTSANAGRQVNAPHKDNKVNTHCYNRRYTYAVSNEIDGLAHPAEGGHIYGLAAHHTSSTDAGGIFTGTRVDNCVHKDLREINM